MRFPDTPIIQPVPGGGPAQLAPSAPVPAAPPVGGSPAPPTAQPEFGGAVGERPGVNASAVGGESHTLDRHGEDRRKLCRRIYHVPVLLDTRSGLDRRGDARRDEDVHVSIDTDV